MCSFTLLSQLYPLVHRGWRPAPFIPRTSDQLELRRGVARCAAGQGSLPRGSAHCTAASPAKVGDLRGLSTTNRRRAPRAPGAATFACSLGLVVLVYVVAGWSSLTRLGDSRSIRLRPPSRTTRRRSGRRGGCRRPTENYEYSLPPGYPLAGAYLDRFVSAASFDAGRPLAGLPSLASPRHLDGAGRLRAAGPHAEPAALSVVVHRSGRGSRLGLVGGGLRRDLSAPAAVVGEGVADPHSDRSARHPRGAARAGSLARPRVCTGARRGGHRTAPGRPQDRPGLPPRPAVRRPCSDCSAARLARPPGRLDGPAGHCRRGCARVLGAPAGNPRRS